MARFHTAVNISHLELRNQTTNELHAQPMPVPVYAGGCNVLKNNQMNRDDEMNEIH